MVDWMIVFSNIEDGTSATCAKYIGCTESETLSLLSFYTQSSFQLDPSYLTALTSTTSELGRLAHEKIYIKLIQ